MADANMRIIITALNQTQGAFKQIKDDLNGLKSSAGGYSDATNMAMGTTKGFSLNLASLGKVAAGVTAAIYAMKKAYDFAEEGAEISRLRTATTNYAAALGGDMEEMVASIRRASGYTISEYDAMSSAGSAMILGLGTDSVKLAQLVEIAAYRGRITGETAAEAFDDIVRGIGRLSPLILDNIGIFIDADKRYAEYAATTGKSADSLTSFEKRQALVNGIIEEAMPIIEEAGGLVDDTKTSYEVLGAWFADQGNKVKEFWGSVADESLAPLADLVQENNALEDAGKKGIITGEEYIDVKTKLAQKTWTEADAMEWLTKKTEEHSYVVTQDMLLSATSAREYESRVSSLSFALNTSQQDVANSIKSYGKYNDMLEQAWKASDMLSQAIQGMISYKHIVIDIEYRIRGMTAEAARLYGQYYSWYYSTGGSQAGKGVPLSAGEIPTTPGRQFGGSVNSGSPYLVGEAGPELFIPQDNGRIVSNNNLGIGGKNVTVNIKYSPTISTASESEVQWVLKPMIQRALRET